MPFWKHLQQTTGEKRRGGGLGSRPKKMYGERLGDGVEYHLMKPTPCREVPFTTGRRFHEISWKWVSTPAPHLSKKGVTYMNKALLHDVWVVSRTSMSHGALMNESSEAEADGCMCPQQDLVYLQKSRVPQKMYKRAIWGGYKRDP